MNKTDQLQHKMTLELYHGRPSPDIDMDDWGTEGPLLYVDFVSVTYSNSIRIQFTGQDDPEFLEDHVVDDCFFYDGVLYGDWSVQPLGSPREMNRSPELFDREKSKEKMKVKDD